MYRPMLLVVWMIVAGPRLAWSQEEPASAEPQQPPAKSEIAALIARQNAVADDYNAILRGIKQQDDVAALEAEISAAQQAVAAAEAVDDDLTEARGAQRAAIKARQALIEQKLAEHPEGAKALAQLKKLRAEQTAHQWDAALAQFQLDSPLSPVTRALSGDDELAELQAKAQTAPHEDRAAAQSAYQSRRREKIAELEEGKRLLAQVEEAEAAADKLAQTIVLVEQRLAPLRKEIETASSADVAEAQAAVESALGRGNLKELRAAHAAAIEKYNARVKELIAADPNAERLKGEYEKLGQQIRELRKASAQPAEGR